MFVQTSQKRTRAIRGRKSREGPGKSDHELTQLDATAAKSLLKNCFVGENAVQFVRLRSRIAGVSDDTSRFRDAEATNFDGLQPE